MSSELAQMDEFGDSSDKVCVDHKWQKPRAGQAVLDQELDQDLGIE